MYVYVYIPGQDGHSSKNRGKVGKIFLMKNLSKLGKVSGKNEIVLANDLENVDSALFPYLVKG